jgi:phenylacetate-CoA ligase
VAVDCSLARPLEADAAVADTMKTLRRWARRWQLRALDRLDAGVLESLSAKRAVRRFHTVARQVPFYAEMLATRGVRAQEVRDIAGFLARCPVLSKSDLFGSVPIHRLCVNGRVGQPAGVLTSSGQGGRFSFGLSSKGQLRRAEAAIELGLQHAFQTDDYKTLLINALPMGVGFSCSTVTVAETSVREDMVSALLQEFGPYYEQVILVLDPLFGKRLIDHGCDQGFDWSAHRVHVILGEETFGENFRAYLARRLGQDPDGWTRGFVGSSMGVAELGLNLFFETRETVPLRQVAQSRPEVLRPALGDWPGRVPPLLFVYDPRRIFVEVLDPDDRGFGDLVVSTLDPTQPLPLLRYRTGDRARRVDPKTLATTLTDAGVDGLALPRLPIIAVAGRGGDQLADGRTLLDLKDALYAEDWVAERVSGAFRVHAQGAACRIEVQLRAGCDGEAEAVASRLRGLLDGLHGDVRNQIQVWRAEEFPWRPTLDFERKFTYSG